MHSSLEVTHTHRQYLPLSQTSIFTCQLKTELRLVTMMMMMMMMMMVFVVWLTDEMRLALFPAGTIVRDPHHRKLRHAASRV